MLIARHILSVLTTTALVLHASVGCCWHHAHERETTVVVQGWDQQKCSCDHEHNSHQHSGDGGQKQNSDHNPCQEGECAFYFAKTTFAEQCRTTYLLTSHCLPMTVSAVESPKSTAVSDITFRSEVYPAPFRALKQIWLL